jgi:uncharacterized protein DUF3159
MSELAPVLDRLGGRRGLVDGAVPSLLFAATNAVGGVLGNGDRALPLAVTAAVTAAVALGVLRRVQGTSLAGVVRGLVVLAAAAGLALRTGQARDFFLPGLYVDAGYAIALAGSVLTGRPLVGYAYAAVFRVGRWRHDARLRRVLGIATLGWAASYALRASVQLVLYRADEPGLLAVAKLVLGWPLTAVAVVLTLRAVRHPAAGTAAEQAADRGPRQRGWSRSNWSASPSTTEEDHVRTSRTGGAG